MNKQDKKEWEEEVDKAEKATTQQEVIQAILGMLLISVRRSEMMTDALFVINQLGQKEQ